MKRFRKAVLCFALVALVLAPSLSVFAAVETTHLNEWKNRLPTVRQSNTTSVHTAAVQRSLWLSSTTSQGKIVAVGGVDGIWGNGTTDCVKWFQGQNGVPTDGIVGPVTWELLYRRAAINTKYDAGGNKYHYGGIGEQAAGDKFILRDVSIGIPAWRVSFGSANLYQNFLQIR